MELTNFSKVTNGDILDEGYFNETNRIIGGTTMRAIFSLAEPFENADLLLDVDKLSADATSTGTLGLTCGYGGLLYDNFSDAATVGSGSDGTKWTYNGDGTVTVTTTGNSNVLLDASPPYSSYGWDSREVNFFAYGTTDKIDFKTNGITEVFISYNLYYQIGAQSGAGSITLGFYLTDGTNEVELYKVSDSRDGFPNTVNYNSDQELVFTYDDTTKEARVALVSQDGYIGGKTTTTPIDCSSLTGQNIYLKIRAYGDNYGASVSSKLTLYSVGYTTPTQQPVTIITKDYSLQTPGQTFLTVFDEKNKNLDTIGASSDGGTTYQQVVSDMATFSSPTSTIKFKHTCSPPTTISSTLPNAVVVRGCATLHE